MDEELLKTLIGKAIDSRGLAYTPYSHFRVGAALLCEDGTIYTGCNIENAAFTPTICAERTAVFKAVSEGKRTFLALCVVGGKEGGELAFTTPCGVCRQVLMEFCNPETFPVIIAEGAEKYQIFTLKELLPMGFGPYNLA